MRFYLGTHEIQWLRRSSVPMLVSHRRLMKRRTLPRAKGSWALDSGGFTELSLHGRWETSARSYVAAVRRYRNHIGPMDWAAPQDWLCEPGMLAKTGLSLHDHQRFSVGSYLRLNELDDTLPWIPVLQGWRLADYVRCVELYDRQGIDLLDGRLVGLGSICSRQATDEVDEIVRELAGIGLNLHAFGAKTLGLRRYGRHLASADSMAWSFDARRRPPLPGHTHGHCGNCIDAALKWRVKTVLPVVQRVADELGQPQLWSSLLQGTGPARWQPGGDAHPRDLLEHAWGLIDREQLIHDAAVGGRQLQLACA